MGNSTRNKPYTPYVIRDLSSAQIVKAHFEISVDCDGLNYRLIYGTHVSGGFCAIPNHNIACELSSPNDTFYNTEALTRCGLDTKVARALAYAIQDVSEEF